jgi:hypothetical protein
MSSEASGVKIIIPVTSQKRKQKTSKVSLKK